MLSVLKLMIPWHVCAMKVEQLCEDQNRLSAYEQIDKFCEHIVTDLPCISKQSDLPTDVNIAVSSLIFAASRCGELPELNKIRNLFKDRYGDQFVSINVDLLPGNLVNPQIKEKLCINPFPEDSKLELLREIARDDSIIVGCLNEDWMIKFQSKQDLDSAVQYMNPDKATAVKNMEKNSLTVQFHSTKLNTSPDPDGSNRGDENGRRREDDELQSRTSSGSIHQIQEKEIVYLDDTKDNLLAQYSSSMKYEIQLHEYFQHNSSVKDEYDLDGCYVHDHKIL
ncbi:hypothetical protein Ancab_025383 [Ancistrocladus abbreviatus]